LKKIIQTAGPITSAHVIAIFCLPFVFFGFYGLSRRLEDQWKFTSLALIILGFGLVAAMFAAVLNGLSLPYFLKQYSEKLEENIAVLKPIVNYSFSLNTSLDYIFIVASILAISIYSMIIIFSRNFPRWIGYLGILLFLFVLIGVITDFLFTSLMGFRVFTFSLAGWILITGYFLIKQDPCHEQTKD